MNDPSLLAPALLLLISGFAHVLARSYRFTSEAGLERLTQKSPMAARRLEGLDLARWNRLRAALDVLDTAGRFGAVLMLGRTLAISDAGIVLQLLAIIGFAFGWIVLHHVLPRALAEGYADRLCLLSLPIMRLLVWPLLPLAYPVAAVETRLHRRLQEESDEGDRPTIEEEILSLVSEDDEEIEDSERELIRSVFEFGDTLTREIMTPRPQVIALESRLTVSEAIDTVKDSRHSRFPVYNDSLDEVLGVVHVKDLLRRSSADQRTEPLENCLMEVSFVSEDLPIDELLAKLRHEQHQTAMVLDAYGGTAGLVTIEDIIEELVGEIEDEYDTAARNLIRLKDGAWLVDASTPVYEVNARTGLQLPESDEYDSLGGYISSHLGRIPGVGEVIAAENYHLVVRAATDRQILKVRVSPRPPTPAESTA